ncbi:hypothetical protein ABZ413_29520 [Nocardia rhamnosiphila]|uniref:hypothetical protein n=1 Tax=Nocardia rhamnosiphila TaxID=426716 RepID=UPI003402109D
MKSFEYLDASQSYAMSVAIQPHREALWAAAFGVETLDGLFDMTPADQAIPVIAAAIAKFNDDPESLRPLLSPGDYIGLRGNRGILVDLRKKMLRMGGTISGAVDESPVPE